MPYFHGTQKGSMGEGALGYLLPCIFSLTHSVAFAAVINCYTGALGGKLSLSILQIVSFMWHQHITKSGGYISASLFAEDRCGKLMQKTIRAAKRFSLIVLLAIKGWDFCFH